MARLLAPALFALPALAACSDTFVPVTEIDKLHLLAIQAEPAEIAPRTPEADPAQPPHRARLTSLIAHPAHLTDATHSVTVIYLACTPRPGVVEGDPCSSFDTLREPAELGDAAGFEGASCEPGASFDPGGGWGEGVVGAFSFAGIEECDGQGCRPASLALDPNQPEVRIQLPEAAYALPADFTFDAYPAGAPQRILGLQVTVLAIALDNTRPEELLAAGPDACAALARLEELSSQRERVLALKRLPVRGPEALDPPNHNPSLSAIVRGQEPLPRAGAEPAVVRALEEVPLTPAPPRLKDGVEVDPQSWKEVWTRCDRGGRVLETGPEDWVFSWFATSGELDKAKTRDFDEPQRFTAPESGLVRVWVVVRDLRGGMAWSVHDLKVE